jgi:hypothetical protein
MFRLHAAIFRWLFLLYTVLFHGSCCLQKQKLTKAAASVEKNCIEEKQPPEDGCMKPKHVVEEEEDNK